MNGRVWPWPRIDSRWRKPALIGVSVAAHVLILGGLALRVLTVEPPRLPEPPPTVYLDIEPRPLLEDETPRPRPQPAPAAAEAAPTTADSRQTFLGLPLPLPRPRDEEDQPPSPPAPRVAAPGAPAPPANADAWQVRPDTMGGRIGRGLRTRGPGCASPQLLSPEERRICDDRFGERAAAAPPISGTGNAERDGRFAREGAAALAQYEARRRPLAGGTGVVGPQDGPGSNFGIGVAGAHLDQSLRPDSTSNVRTRRDGDRAGGQPLTPGGGFDRE
ncbi:hypothetical protein [Brevundimonas sp. GCM10030266]|uniref:hypothetical protein n=1 Tax=Brevundimonas sp. GCM10030266 TaxID=3273386 RepID=UPI003615BB11